MAPRQPNNLTNSEREGIRNFLLQRFDDDNKHHREYIPHLPDGHGVHHASQGQQQLPSGAHEEGQTATES